MAFIRQRNKKDCGVAAIAMICDVTYEEAERVIPWRRHGCLHGTDTKMLRAAAARLGYEGLGTPKHQLKRLGGGSWQDIPDNSLIKIPHPNGSGWGWHWVAWRKGKVYDPARGVFKPGEHGVEPSSYMHFVPEGTEDCPKCGTPTETQWSGIKCPSCGWTHCT